jgi:hypothetical protein
LYFIDRHKGEIMSKSKSVNTLYRGVYFKINTGTPTSCGVTRRQITAVLTNVGDENAHNVKVNFDVYNNIGENLYSTQEQLGDIPSYQSISRTVTMNIDCGSVLSLYSKCRKHMLKLTVIFDEGIQAFPDYVYNTKF